MTTALEQDVVTLDAGAPVLLVSVSEPDAIRVLLIEDGVIDRGFLTDEMSKQGFAVRTVASLSDAPDAARDADVIVLHCDRANYSGIDLLVKLHRLGVNVPVVLMTGQALPAHECPAFERRGRCHQQVTGLGGSDQAPHERGQGFQSHGPTAVRQIHDLRQAASASRCQPGLLEGRRSRPHPW
jgi:CheY-like chemotaxis protein